MPHAVSGGPFCRGTHGLLGGWVQSYPEIMLVLQKSMSITKKK